MGYIPVSREVNNYVVKRDPSLTRFSVLGYFDNKIFVSVNPFRVTAQDRLQHRVTDYAHAGFAVINLETMATFLTQGSPVWDGLWTGVNPMDITTINKRCFVISKDGDGYNGFNRIYEIEKGSTYDEVFGGKRPVTSIIYTREYSCGAPFVEKQENTLVVDIKEIVGDCELEVEKKPDHSAEFLPYIKWAYRAAKCRFFLGIEGFTHGYAPMNIKRLVFGDSNSDRDCNPVTGDLYNRFFSVQLRLKIRGLGWVLKAVKVRATQFPAEERQEDCSDLPPNPIRAQCEPDWLPQKEVPYGL